MALIKYLRASLRSSELTKASNPLSIYACDRLSANRGDMLPKRLDISMICSSASSIGSISRLL